MIQLEQELHEFIKKSLPHQVCAELQKVLRKAADDEHKVDVLTSQLKERDADIENYKDIINRYARNDERNNQLDDREAAVTKRENNAEIELLKVRLAAEESKTLHATAVAMGLVRNTEYRRILNDNTTEPGQRDQYGNMTIVNKHQNSEEINTAD